MTIPSFADSRNRKLTFPSDLTAMDDVVNAAEAFAAEFIQDEELSYKFILLTTEAVTNAVEHGNKSDPAKSVHVDFIAGEDHVEVAVLDEGEGFDPAAVSDPLLEENLLREGGRGLFLIASLADEYRYEESGRRLRMIFRNPA